MHFKEPTELPNPFVFFVSAKLAKPLIPQDQYLVTFDFLESGKNLSVVVNDKSGIRIQYVDGKTAYFSSDIIDADTVFEEMVLFEITVRFPDYDDDNTPEKLQDSLGVTLQVDSKEPALLVAPWGGGSVKKLLTQMYLFSDKYGGNQASGSVKEVVLTASLDATERQSLVEYMTKKMRAEQ